DLARKSEADSATAPARTAVRGDMSGYCCQTPAGRASTTAASRAGSAGSNKSAPVRISRIHPTPRVEQPAQDLQGLRHRFEWSRRCNGTGRRATMLRDPMGERLAIFAEARHRSSAHEGSERPSNPRVFFMTMSSTLRLSLRTLLAASLTLGLGCG